MNNPLYLSIVLVGRNDNYGGDFKTRLENCILWTHKALSIFKIKSEIVFVNYNPLPQPAIKQFIQWPKSNSFTKTRIITVSNIHHQKFLEKNTNVKDIPVLEYLAKNIGIRRAEGRFVLSMNPDIIIPKNIFRKIAQKKLIETCFYRCNRVDFNGSLKWNSHQEPDFTSIKKNTSKVFMKGFSYSLKNLTWFKYAKLNLRNTLRCINGLLSTRFEDFYIRRNWTVYYHNSEFKYHCNVSGDFMLMSRKSWNKLNGHPENIPVALHNDALTVVMAGCLPLNEKVFSNPIFHQSHESRFSNPQKEKEFREAYLNFQKKSQDMIVKNKPIIGNDETWGLATFALPELIVND